MSSFFENTRKPMGLGGRIMVSMMNLGHRALADWGFQFLPAAISGDGLDCGCGGGANVEKLLKKYPAHPVTGIDYSEISVEKAQRVNQKAIQAGRCQILSANVMNLPFEDDRFALVTAFETIYFWPDLLQSLREIYCVLKPGGIFFLCNECSGDTDSGKKWTEIIDGMTIYCDAQLQTALEQAGFCRIEIHKNKKGWLCMSAQK